MATFTPAHVANFFLDSGFREDRLVDPLKLQKLVYFGYGWVLAVLDEKLFDEPIEAWRHGPVVPSLYHEFKRYRWTPITEFALSVDWDTREVIEPRISRSPKSELVLSKAWDTYKRFSGADLRKMTHQPDTPWANSFDPERPNERIPDHLIKSYFEDRIRSDIRYYLK